jgi:putative ABC transport system substrate-binding protein
MRRRDFLGIAIGGASLVWPRIASAQQSGRLPIIGFLGVNPAVWASWTGAFVDRLNALGWIDGKTAKLEFRWAQGRPELHTQFANEFAQLGANVIVTSGAAVPALMQATSTIPIVFAVANDPVGAGMVKSLARPGGNVTGISLQTLDLANKRFEFFREAVVNVQRLAIMADATFTQAMLELNTVRELAHRFGIETILLEIRRTEDIEPAFARARAEKANALYVVINELLNANRLLIVTSAEAAKLPSIYGTHDWVRSGGLMSYGPNFPSLFSRSAEITDKILRGARPADIPVEQPTRFELVVNLKTAKAIGAQISEAFLARADDVIE